LKIERTALLLALSLHLWAFSRLGALPFMLGLLLAGMAAALAGKRGIYFVLFLLPLVNSLVWFLPVELPFNYPALSLYPVVGYVLFKKEGEKSTPYYSFFLPLLWTGAFFLLLRWSNITLSPLAFLKNTPVAPGGPRLSFGILLLAFTLFLYTAGSRGYHLLKDINLDLALRTMSLSTLISLGVALIQSSGRFVLLPPGPWRWVFRYNGTFSDPNAAGIFSAALFSWLLLRSKSLKEALWSLPPLGMVFLSSSRTGLIIVFLAMVFFVFDKALSTKFKAIFVPIFLLGLLVSLPHLHRRMKKYVKENPDMTVVSEGRNILYSRALRALKTAPLSGVGPGNFIFFVMAEYDNPGLNDVVPSVYLGMAAELGMAGLAGFLLFLLPYLLARPGPEKKVFLLFLFALLVHSALWNPEVILLFFFLLGQMKPPEMRWQRIARLLLLASFLLGSLVSFQKLHPATWSVEKGKIYSYGLYPREEGFSWTRKKAGIYFIFRKPVILESGFPFEKTGRKAQKVRVFWRGKRLKTLTFTPSRRKAELEVRGRGFLEFRISPTFVPARFERKGDRRVLGVKILGTW